MRTNLVIACVLLAASYAAAQPGTGSGSGSGSGSGAPAAPPAPTAPPAPSSPTPAPTTTPDPTTTPTTPTTAPDPNAPPQQLGGTSDAPPVVVEPQPQPQPPPPPSPPSPQPQPAPTSTADKPEPKESPSHWTQPRCKKREYYNCERGFGIFHRSRLVLGALSGDVATTTMDPASGMSTSTYGGKTAGVLAFEAAFLGVPSSFAPTNFHGIEVSTGIRTSPFDYWLQFGTAVTVLNLGSGGIGTLRVGGSFGAGFDLAHGYGYLRGRGAMIILPERLDIEVSAQWTPASASTDNFDVETYRLSAWYRINEKSKRAVEIYVEKFSRLDADRDATNPMYGNDEEIVDGMGFGVGLSFF